MRDGIAVILASVGRPVELGRWVEHMARQTVKPVEMIWAVSSDDDLPAQFRSLDRHPGLTIVRSPIGLTKQRNRGLEAITTEPAFIAFFDDDYVPTTTTLEDIIFSFAALPDVVGLTGTMLADGINSCGVSYEDAVALVRDYEATRRDPTRIPGLQPWEGLYGCNMIYRAEVIDGERFDEKLPLYAWQEDVDFAVRVAKGRRIGRTDGFAGVHQGVKSGRGSGKRLGYSQIVNPLYLFIKGSMKWRKALSLAARNVIANHVRSLRPEFWVDRRGRALGNWLGIFDVLRGRVDPMRVLDL